MYESNGAVTAAAVRCVLMMVGPCWVGVTPADAGEYQPADCELPRKLDGYFFFWAFSAAFVTLPWVSLKVTLCEERDRIVESDTMLEILFLR